MTTDTLLPPNASALELALEQAMRPGTDVRDGVVLVRTAKEVLPDGWPMFLVWEYGLEELLPYLSDPRVVLVTGLQWQRIKGTPASLRMALAWLGLDASVEQESATGRHWFEYQINPGEVPDRAVLENLVGLARLSAPVGTRLGRVYHGYDRRKAIYDRTRWSDGTLYSDQSGVYDPDLDVDLSFGQTGTSAGELGQVATAGTTLVEHTTVVNWRLRGRYDFARWGETAPMRNYPGRSHIEGVGSSSPGVSASQAAGAAEVESLEHYEFSWSDGEWDDRTWGEPRSMLSSGVLYIGTEQVFIDGLPIIFPSVTGVVYVDGLPLLVDGLTVTINELDNALMIDDQAVKVDTDTINFG